MGTPLRITGLLALLLVTRVSAGAQPPSPPVPTAAPSVEASFQDGAYVVLGRFEVPASRDVAWSVLTDYEHVAQFVPTVRKSIVRLRRAEFVYVEQDAVETALFVSKEMHVMLRISEEKDRLSFRDISQRDFRVYEGTWTLETLPGGCRVIYSLRATPRLSVPGFVAEPSFKNAGARMLDQLRAEMVRRARAKTP